MNVCKPICPAIPKELARRFLWADWKVGLRLTVYASVWTAN